jgi:hypothetical protein
MIKFLMTVLSTKYSSLSSVLPFYSVSEEGRMRRMLPAVTMTLVLVSSSARAHHSHPDFLLNQNVTIEGEIEELQYANPHVVLKVRTAEGVVYTAEWQAAAWLVYHAHVTLTTFRIGDHLIVTGAPSRDPEVHELVRLKEVRRPRDGWTYQVNQEGPVTPSPKR